MSWKEKLAYRMLENKVSGIERERNLVSIENARKIGIIWYIEESEAFQYITEYLKNTKAIIRHLCYTGAQEITSDNSNTFSKKDLNWLGFPVSGKVTPFITMQFDLLLNISTYRIFAFDAIMALSKASFKIGWSPLEDKHLDLNIDISKNIDSLFLVKQQIFYLGQLNKISKK